jgi:N-methylhydantoinase A
LRVAIDTGGTFTDCVFLRDGHLQAVKVLSTPADPARAVLEALTRLGAEGVLEVRHGTTVGTNAMLEREGARVAFVTTSGFEDTIAIGRQNRQRLYDWFAPLPECLVPRPLRFGVPERVSAEGEILRSPTDEELQSVVDAVRSSGAEAVAISLLFSFANTENERRVGAALGSPNIPVSSSHRILPEFREYERASTTVVNAYLAPKMQSYLLRLEEGVTRRNPGSRVDVMQSSGGIISARVAAQEPVRSILSGPAGGVIGASAIARLAGLDRIIGIDMGGTSTDVFLADMTNGGAFRTNESVVAGIPVSVPMLDIHTAGAGGGSIARFDAGGMLRVGPESAGSNPGPICFGRGTLPTVTDANLLLGRLDPKGFLDGEVHLDLTRTRQLMSAQKGPLKTVEEFAAGIVRVVETQMEKAIRVISIERGHDPRDFTLVAFGGGGPLHACALARALRIPRILIPTMPGVLSAAGIFLADVVRDYSCTVMLPGNAIGSLQRRFDELEQLGKTEFAAEGIQGSFDHTIDIRYRGQGYELNVPYAGEHPMRTLEAFHELHLKRYGFHDPEKPVEIVNLRLRMTAAAEPYMPPCQEPSSKRDAAADSEADIYFDGKFVRTRLYRREQISPGMVVHGPATITEYTSATALPPGWLAEGDRFGNIVITSSEARG